MSAVLEQSAEPQYKIEDVVLRYVQLRDQKDKIAADAKAQTETIGKQLQVIEGWLHGMLQKLGAESFKTEHGTAFIKQTDYAGVQDFNLVVEYVKQNDAWNLLKKDVNKTAVKEYINEHGVPPPGVNYGMKQEVQVRRA